MRWTRWLVGWVHDLVPDGRTLAARRFYRNHTNPHDYPPEGHLCPCCLRFWDTLPDTGICVECTRDEGELG